MTFQDIDANLVNRFIRTKVEQAHEGPHVDTGDDVNVIRSMIYHENYLFQQRKTHFALLQGLLWASAGLLLQLDAKKNADLVYPIVALGIFVSIDAAYCMRRARIAIEGLCSLRDVPRFGVHARVHPLLAGLGPFQHLDKEWEENFYHDETRENFYSTRSVTVDLEAPDAAVEATAQSVPVRCRQVRGGVARRLFEWCFPRVGHHPFEEDDMALVIGITRYDFKERALFGIDEWMLANNGRPFVPLSFAIGWSLFAWQLSKQE